MKTMLKIIKGMLLWITAFLITLYIIGIESIVENPLLLFGGLFLIILSLLLCQLFNITENDIKELSGYNLLNRFFKV